MFYIFFAFILLLGQLLLVTTRNVIIPEEMYMYSWFINNNVVLYKDIFINHGFALYLLLSLIPLDRYVLLFKIFFVGIQLLNLALVLLIVKKHKSKIAFVLSGIFYITISFLCIENVFWDEVVLTTACLLIVYIVGLHKKYHWITGCLVAFMVLTKPTAIVFLIPLFFFTKNRSVFYSFFATILVGLGYLVYHNALFQFFENVFIYNVFYGKQVSTYVPLPSVAYFMLLIYYLIAILILSSIVGKAFKKSLLEFSFLFPAYIFLIPTLNLTHAVPFISIFTIYAVSVTVSSNKYIKVILIILFFLFYFNFLYKKTKHTYVDILKNTSSYLQSDIPNNLVKDVKNAHIKVQNMYVFGNLVTPYILLNKPPIVYHIAVYTWVSDYYKNIEQETINQIKTNHVNLVIVPKPMYITYSHMDILSAYIHKNFQLVKDTSDYEMYVKE